MAERTHMRPVDAEAGFTLAEMLAALGILLFGVTALLGALSASVGQRRTTDARHALTALCEHAMHRVRHEAVTSTTGDSSPFDLEFTPLTDQTVPGFPGMSWTATATVDEDRPDLWLVTIRASWLDQGEEVVAEFLRVLPRQLPLRDRVLSFKNRGAGGSARTR
ncbi:MAG TPA: type II secretion system protein [bacterium]|nr:type II secretion system protein [bacterium]